MSPELIPDWVPDSVKTVAIGMQIDNERMRRLLSDERMKSVWSYIRKQQVDESGFEIIPLNESMRGLDINQWSHSLAERTCAAVYLVILEASVSGDVAITRSLLEKSGSRYIETIENCRWLASGDLFPVLTVPDDVKQALQTIQLYCENRWQFLMQENNPRRLEMSSGVRNDDVIRGHVRKIATSFVALFGKILAGNLATIVNVVFAPKKEVTDKNVRNWCEKLPPNLRTRSLGES